MNKIGSYVNGNTIVFMYDDGTKERYTKDGEKPQLEYPESIDLKITNKCDMGCEMCAECSTLNGPHANLDNPLLKTLKPYTELAIGGGNPLEHPDLDRFLTDMKVQKVICNITVNVKHFMDNTELLKTYINDGLIHGLGISLPNDIPDGFFEAVKEFPTAVIHTIAGWTPLSVYFQLMNRGLNLLILGFKMKGRGRDVVSRQVTDYIKQFKDLVWQMIPCFKGIAFDNLAVEQLSIADMVSPDDYEKLYMGKDGEFTMYIDLVTNKYGKSSTHAMIDILYDVDSSDVSTLFRSLQE